MGIIKSCKICSTKLTDNEQKEKIHHSGAGRIGKINMYTMSLYESGDSTGKASLQEMLKGTLKNQTNQKITYKVNNRRNSMLNSKGFDLWADNYDKTVEVSDNDNTYPFAGYKNILNEIYNCILESSSKNILDIGFGTGILTTKLYEKGCNIYGQDFSDKMVELAKEKMPNSKLFKGDFSKGIVKELKEQKYDAIIATYSLHHLTDKDKINFIKELIELLNEKSIIYIGDVAFKTREDLEKCKEQCGEHWDNEEIYFVYDEIKKEFTNSEFIKYSECAGIIKIW